MQAQGVGPPVLVAKRIVAEDLAPGLDLIPVVVVVVIVITAEDEAEEGECDDHSGDGSRPQGALAEPLPHVTTTTRHDLLLLRWPTASKQTPVRLGRPIRDSD